MLLNFLINYYRPQRSWGKVMFSHVCLILFTGGSASVNAGIPPPGKADPPWQGDPPAQCMLGNTVNKRAVWILLECNSCYVLKELMYQDKYKKIQFKLYHKKYMIWQVCQPSQLCVITEKLERVSDSGRLAWAGRKSHSLIYSTPLQTCLIIGWSTAKADKYYIASWPSYFRTDT